MSHVCDEAVQHKIDEWCSWDKNPATCDELKGLVASNEFEQLRKILLKRLTFGTAGLRGRMGTGYARMNDLVIIQTGQGMLKYLEHAEAESLKHHGIVVGYDGRHNSRRWAELTATIFLHAGYPVKLFGEVTPTPFIPFAVKKYGCASGIMVTASHNPKEDNGYKVYGSNGTQIIPPADKNIQKSILENLPPLESSWDTSILGSSSLLTDPFKEVLDDYLKIISKSIYCEHLIINGRQGMLFVYSAMHGVGNKCFEEVCKVAKIKMLSVPEQKDPDPEFSTVKFPNPEEGKESLDLAIRLANQNNCHVILANDPDADRMALAEKDPSTNEWKVFTGNETGALLGWWMLLSYKKRHPEVPNDKIYMISSTVSSMILRTMAQKEGFNFVDTLTGFKWIGNKTIDLEKQGYKVIFGFEEAIGFMCESNVIDKDGISAAAHCASMASHTYYHNKTLRQKLDEIYSEYGFHLSKNSYYICDDLAKIRAIFDRIRNRNGKNQYPTEILGGKYKITSVRDLTTGYDNSQPDNRAVLPVSCETQMITFHFDVGLVCTLRTSGTEPKVKYYTELCASPGIKDRPALQRTLEEMVAAICEEMYEPSKNGLIPQGS